MTSEDEKTVHQQSITEVGRALDYVAVTTCASGFQPERWSSDNDEIHLRVLAAEVRRLRDVARALADDKINAEQEAARLREQWESTARQREKADEAFATMSADYERLREELAAVRVRYMANLDDLAAEHTKEADRLRDIYEQAVKGRQQFRAAFREAREALVKSTAEIDRLVSLYADAREEHVTERDGLREAYDLEQKTAFVLAQKVTAMGDESRLFREAGEAAELRIVELRAKLARVEAVFGELFDREVGGEKVSTYDAIEAFRMALID